MSKKLFIIDGSSFLFRAYYGLKPLYTKSNEAVHAVYGFISMIKKLLKDQKAERLVIAWDSKGPTTRHTLFPEYKAQRLSAPSDLQTQKDRILEFSNIIGIQSCSKQGIEADDIMATLALQWTKQETDHEAIVVSSDKDLMQILQHPNIYMFDPFKDRYFDTQAAEEKFKIPITKLPFYFGLLGDSSDNIPGVKGIGPKTAEKIVNQYADFTDLYANLHTSSLSPRIQSLLTENKKNAYLSQQLFTIDYTIPVTCAWNKTAITLKSFERATSLFQELEMKSFLKEFGSAQHASPQAQPLHEIYNFICVTTTKQLQKIAQEIQEAGSFAVDTETTDFNPLTSIMVGISICTNVGTAYYIPVAHTQQHTLFSEPASQQTVTLRQVQDILGPCFADPTITTYMHNAVFDEIVLEKAGLPVYGFVFDTLLAASLTIPEWQKKGLKDLSEYLFTEPMLHFRDVLKQEKVKSFDQVSLPLATKYAAADAHQTLKLYHALEKKLIELEVDKLFYNLESPVKNILKDMQVKGIACNAHMLEQEHSAALKKLDAISQEIFQLTGKHINLNSPAQVKDLLFNVLQLPPQKKSSKKTGYSTDAEVLQTLSSMHVVPGLILQYRELSKIISTYLQGLQPTIDPKTSTIHSTFHQSLVATGRLSSSNPNLQNIPTGLTAPGIQVRKAFYAPEGYMLIGADYSQIELRILAHFSQDPDLLAAFENNIDIHTTTAVKLFNADIAHITPEQRSIGKKINFSILYGLTPYGLSKDLQIPFNQAKEYISTYFDQYPKIQEWMNATVEQTKKYGYTQTWQGRKRFVPGIYEKNTNLFNFAKRIAINTPVQGTAAEIMKLGMLAYTQACKENNIHAPILLQIHDEIIVQAPENKVQQVQSILKTTLEYVAQWKVALQVNTKIGKNWQDITK